MSYMCCDCKHKNTVVCIRCLYCEKYESKGENGRSPLAISTCYGYEKGNPTNADLIRSMTDEELANKFAEIEGDPYNGATIGFWLDWLREEVSADG